MYQKGSFQGSIDTHLPFNSNVSRDSKTSIVVIDQCVCEDQCMTVSSKEYYRSPYKTCNRKFQHPTHVIFHLYRITFGPNNSFVQEKITFSLALLDKLFIGTCDQAKKIYQCVLLELLVKIKKSNVDIRYNMISNLLFIISCPGGTKFVHSLHWRLYLYDRCNR